MIYLVVGLLAPWHRNVRRRDVASARRTAVAHAGADGVDFLVAAVIGPGTNVLEDHTTLR